MKTANLIVGLLRGVGAVGCMFLAAALPIPLAVLLWAAAVVNGWCAGHDVMESLFGRNGLVCEVFPGLDSSEDGEGV